MSGTALIVIDAQAALFDPVPRPHEADAVLARIHHLARAARVAGVPVVWVQHEDPREGHALAQGSPGWAVHPAAGPDAADVFNRKTTPDRGGVLPVRPRPVEVAAREPGHLA